MYSQTYWYSKSLEHSFAYRVRDLYLLYSFRTFLPRLPLYDNHHARYDRVSVAMHNDIVWKREDNQDIDSVIFFFHDDHSIVIIVLIVGVVPLFRCVVTKESRLFSHSFFSFSFFFLFFAWRTPHTHHSQTTKDYYLQLYYSLCMPCHIFKSESITNYYSYSQ